MQHSVFPCELRPFLESKFCPLGPVWQVCSGIRARGFGQADPGLTCPALRGSSRWLVRKLRLLPPTACVEP